MKKTRFLSRTLPIGIGLMTLAAFVGSISGSLAWWAYSTRVVVSYTGTTVGTSNKLQAGIEVTGFTNEQIADLTAFGLDSETIAGRTYVFSRASGGLSEDVVKTYLTLGDQYAIDKLQPVTSRTYTTGPIRGDMYYVTSESHVKIMNGSWSNLPEALNDEALPADPEVDDKYYITSTDKVKRFNGSDWEEIEINGTVATEGDLPSGANVNLYEPPLSGVALNTNTAAKNKYVQIPFVFRVLELNAVDPEDLYSEGVNIYLSRAEATMAGSNPESRVGDGLRLFFDNGGLDNKMIVKPNDTTTTDTNLMKTDVCGLLNLGGFSDSYDSISNQEILYGDYTGTPTNTFVQATDPTALSNINNIAGVTPAMLEDIETNHTTFLAAHAKGNTCLADYSGITKGYAEYRSLKYVAPSDVSISVDGGVPLTTTAGLEGNYLAHLTTTIWLEGWDHATVDAIVGDSFTLDLVFEIDSL